MANYDAMPKSTQPREPSFQEDLNGLNGRLDSIRNALRTISERLYGPRPEDAKMGGPTPVDQTLRDSILTTGRMVERIEDEINRLGERL